MSAIANTAPPPSTHHQQDSSRRLLSSSLNLILHQINMAILNNQALILEHQQMLLIDVIAPFPSCHIVTSETHDAPQRFWKSEKDALSSSHQNVHKMGIFKINDEETRVVAEQRTSIRKQAGVETSISQLLLLNCSGVKFNLSVKCLHGIGTQQLALHCILNGLNNTFLIQKAYLENNVNTNLKHMKTDVSKHKQ